MNFEQEAKYIKSLKEFLKMLDMDLTKKFLMLVCMEFHKSKRDFINLKTI